MKPTPKAVIESTINRKYTKPNLTPPVFQTELIKFEQGRNLEQVLSSLAKPNLSTVNTFKPVKRVNVWQQLLQRLRSLNFNLKNQIS